MEGLNEAKRVLTQGRIVNAIGYDHYSNPFRVLQIVREEGHYYGKAEDGIWYPVRSIEIQEEDSNG